MPASWTHVDIEYDNTEENTDGETSTEPDGSLQDENAIGNDSMDAGVTTETDTAGAVGNCGCGTGQSNSSALVLFFITCILLVRRITISRQ